MKISLLFQILRHSVTSIKKYNHLLLLSNKTIVLYFFVWVTVFSVFQAIHFATHAVPQTISSLSTAFSEGIAYYPNDLVFNWDGDSTLQSNYETIKAYYPSNFSPSEYLLPSNLGTYVSSEVSPNEEFSDYLLVGTPTTLHMQEGTGIWNSISYHSVLTDVPATEFTKSDAEWLYQQWQNEQENILLVTQIIALLIKIITGVVFDTITVLLRALFILLIVKFLARLKTTYKKVLKLAALFTVPALLVETAVIYMYNSDIYGLGGFTFWLLFILYMWFGKVIIKKKPVA